LPTVPEVLLKKRRTRVHTSWVRSAKLSREGAARRARRVEQFKRAEKYAQFYRCKTKNEVSLRLAARAQGRVRVPGEAKLAFVMRTKG